jgi:hypothetical protein
MGIPSHFEYHCFCFMDFKEQARTRKQVAQQLAECMTAAQKRFYMDYGIMWASMLDYQRPNKVSDRVIMSFDGFTSFLLIVDEVLHHMWVFLSSTKDPIVYLLLAYGANTHEACSSDLVYLVTWNPFTLLLGCKWTYVATVHSSSHQAMTPASDQLHTTSFCSPPVLGNTCNTRDTRNTHDVQLLLLLVHV